MDSPSAFWNPIMHINVNRRPRGRHFVPRSLVFKSVLIPFTCSSDCSTNSWSHRYFPRICLMRPLPDLCAKNLAPLLSTFNVNVLGLSVRNSTQYLMNKPSDTPLQAEYHSLSVELKLVTFWVLDVKCTGTPLTKWMAHDVLFPKEPCQSLSVWTSTDVAPSSVSLPAMDSKLFIPGFPVSAAAMLWARQSSTLQSLTMLSTMRL